MPLAGTGVTVPSPGDAPEEDFVACGVAGAASSMNVPSGLLLHQDSPDNATDCTEEFAPDVFPPNNPEQPTSKRPTSNTARESQDRLANKEIFISFLIHHNIDIKRDHTELV
jgi:hypothetical protein